MPEITVEGLKKHFGSTAAVDGIDFHCENGKITTLLGPSGCGKSTTLRCIAGLEIPDEGEIRIGEKLVTSCSKGIHTRPEKREIGMVFQNYAIWPHMNVFENVAYGLKVRKVPKAEIKKRVKTVLELVSLEGLEDRDATALSGGQQQRVALARSLVYEPKVLLLDEPLSNLDAKLRDLMRFELTSLINRVGVTTIYVTHDQSEAIVLSHKMIIMNKGRIEQLGHPKHVYCLPCNQFVAEFLGGTNFLSAKVINIPNNKNQFATVLTEMGTNFECIQRHGLKKADSVVILLKPENVKIFKKASTATFNILKGKITRKAFIGDNMEYWFKVQGKEFRVITAPDSQFEEGESIYVQFDPKGCRIVPYC